MKKYEKNLELKKITINNGDDAKKYNYQKKGKIIQSSDIKVDNK